MSIFMEFFKTQSDQITRKTHCPPPPPLEIEKKKKKKRSSEQICSYFTYILLLFKSKISFSQLFSELGPPP